MVTKEVGEAVGGLKKLVPTGTCVLIEGLLADTPEGTKQVRLPGVGRLAAKSLAGNSLAANSLAHAVAAAAAD